MNWIIIALVYLIERRKTSRRRHRLDWLQNATFCLLSGRQQKSCLWMDMSDMWRKLMKTCHDETIVTNSLGHGVDGILNDFDGFWWILLGCFAMGFDGLIQFCEAKLLSVCCRKYNNLSFDLDHSFGTCSSTPHTHTHTKITAPQIKSSPTIRCNKHQHEEASLFEVFFLVVTMMLFDNCLPFLRCQLTVFFQVRSLGSGSCGEVWRLRFSWRVQSCRDGEAMLRYPYHPYGGFKQILFLTHTWGRFPIYFD